MTDAAASLLKAGATEGQEKFRATMEEVTRRSNELRHQVTDRARSTARVVGRQASVLSHELEDTIERHPMGSLAVALGLGFIIGLAARRH
jgi:ElaB/YqjD/DUF883 family membrane-anchored ribosome-binding protein